MNERPLAGFRLWSTRPAGRGSTGMEALRTAGAEVIERPVIGFEPAATAEVAAARQLWSAPEAWDWIIFPSAAALATVADWPLPEARADLALAAVGEASARAVRSTFRRPCLAGPGTGGAAGLLSLSAFSADTIAGQRVLLVQGEGGRDLLEATLRARGAEVAVARVYRRVALALDLSPGAWPTGFPLALTLSSGDLATAVAAVASSAGADWVTALGVVAWSERIAAAAHAVGLHGPCACLPPERGEEALVETCQWLWARLPNGP